VEDLTVKIVEINGLSVGWFGYDGWEGCGSTGEGYANLVDVLGGMCHCHHGRL